MEHGGQRRPLGAEAGLDFDGVGTGCGKGFEAGGEGGRRAVRGELSKHCRPQPDMSRECLSVAVGGWVSGNELGCASVERLVWCTLSRLPIALQADPLNSWHVAYICSFVTFERQTRAGGLKGGFLCSRAMLSSTAASQLPASLIYGSRSRREGPGP